MYKKVSLCRVCGTPIEQKAILELGNQFLTGVFPKSEEESITCGPLSLVRCLECGLVQLGHSYDLSELYGNNYGYRSGLNLSMVEHLRTKVLKLREMVEIWPGDIVVDIGSNDGTLLSFYPKNTGTLIGFDPSAAKFQKYYREDIRLITDFFSADTFRAKTGGGKAKIVTSIAMFYDLEQPLEFMRQVAGILADDGLWHFEQSYLPSMISTNAYDTVCHEHLEYYALRQIKWMIDQAGLKIVGVEFNDVNGGSFAVSAARASASFPEARGAVTAMLEEEMRLGFDGVEVYAQFKQRVHKHREELLALLRRLKTEGKKVLGYGASTKGNVILQFCGIDASLLPFIAEVNADKFGCMTPGTRIPIISEQEAHAMKPDYFLVFPWHFKANLVKRETNFLHRGGKMIFPLPEISMVGS